MAIKQPTVDLQFRTSQTPTIKANNVKQCAAIYYSKDVSKETLIENPTLADITAAFIGGNVPKELDIALSMDKGALRYAALLPKRPAVTTKDKYVLAYIPKATTVAKLKAVSNGTLSITIDASVTKVDAIDLSTAVSYDAVAAILDTALAVHNVAVSYDAAANVFVFMPYVGHTVGSISTAASPVSGGVKDIATMISSDSISSTAAATLSDLNKLDNASITIKTLSNTYTVNAIDLSSAADLDAVATKLSTLLTPLSVTNTAGVFTIEANEPITHVGSGDLATALNISTIDIADVTNADDVLSHYLSHIAHSNVTYIAINDRETDALKLLLALRANDYLSAMLVCSHDMLDSEYAINFVSDVSITLEKVTTKLLAKQYLYILASNLCQVDYSASITYVKLPFITAVEISSKTADTLTQEGALFISMKAGAYRYSKGITALTTDSPIKGDAFKSIHNINIMDLIREAISSTWNNSYVGKIPNDVNARLNFMGTVVSFLTTLADGKVRSKLISFLGNPISLDRGAVIEYALANGLKDPVTGLDYDRLTLEALTDDQLLLIDTGDSMFFFVDISVLRTADNLRIIFNI